MEQSSPAFDLNAVMRLAVFHLPPSVSTTFDVLPGQLENLDVVKRIELTDPQILRAAFDALCASEPTPDPEGHSDSHWGALFIGRNGEILLAAYTDRFGVQGTIDDERVKFPNSTFLDWLERQL